MKARALRKGDLFICRDAALTDRLAVNFSSEFAFLLTPKDVINLRSQIVTSSWTRESPRSHGGRRYLPHAITEHGAIVAADAIKELTALPEPEEPEKPQMGFRASESARAYHRKRER